jgi:S-adenosylmethionine decarboxylase
VAPRADHGDTEVPFGGIPALATGREWLVEAFGCDPARLASVAALDRVFTTAVHELALRPLGATRWHQFPAPGGVTGLSLLAESHLTVHTFPEHASACFNLFCCTPRRAWDWEARLRELLGAQSVRVRVLDREYAPVPDPA